jgi:uncharacterized protein with FMN-binding domain
MRRITLWLLSTVVAVVLLFSYRTSTMGSGGSSSQAASGVLPQANDNAAAGTGGSSGSTPTPGASSSASSGSSSSGKTSTGTVTGSVAQTRWGPVQVQITVSGKKITKVSTLQVPNGNFRDTEINNYAVPILVQETLTAQSANIDSVSGATVTSDGYRASLQSALDAAHLG